MNGEGTGAGFAHRELSRVVPSAGDIGGAAAAGIVAQNTTAIGNSATVGDFQRASVAIEFTDIENAGWVGNGTGAGHGQGAGVNRGFAGVGVGAREGDGARACLDEGPGTREIGGNGASVGEGVAGGGEGAAASDAAAG